MPLLDGFCTLAASPLAPQSLTVELVTDAAGLAALEPHWDALVEEMQCSSPFVRWDWVSTWWRHFGAKHSLAVAVARRRADGSLCGIAPCMVGYSRDRGCGLLPCLTWISGMGPAQGERMDLIIPSGAEATVAPALLRCLRRLPFKMLWLGKLPAESPSLPFIHTSLDATTTGVSEAERLCCHYMQLPQQWAELEQRQSSRWRRNLRNRKQAFASTEGGGSQGLAGQQLPLAESIETLASLHAQHWPTGVSNFLEPSAWAFHREIAQRWLATGRALMPLLLVAGRAVAATYGFIERGTFLLYQQGWDRQYARLSLGNLSVAWSIEHCMQQGLHSYDMLAGDYRYKSEWCPEVRQLVALEAFSPSSLLCAAYRGARQLSQGLKRLHGSSGTLEPLVPSIAE